MSRRVIDLAFASTLCLASIYLWIVADGFPGSPRYAQIDTDFWPKIVMGLMAVLTGIIALQNAASLLRERGMGAADLIALDWRAIGRMAAMAGLVVAYFLAFGRIGFLLATLAFLWIAAFALPGGRPLAKLIFAPVFTIALTALFSRVLTLPLPRGQGVFYQFSLLFY